MPRAEPTGGAASPGRRDGWLAVPALLVLVAGALVLPRVGVGTDEIVHHQYGLRLLRYYSTFGADKSLFGFVKADYYGGLYNLVAAVAERLLPGLAWYDVRHALSLLCGALALLFTAGTAARLGGPRCGLLAGIFLAATPRFVGEALFNPKDVPFAAAYAAATYFVVRYGLEGEQPRWATTVGIGLAAGGAAAIRIVGLFALAVFATVAVLATVFTVRRSSPAAGLAEARRRLAHLLLAGVLTATVTWAFWPYLHQHPLAHLVDVLRLNAQFPWDHPMLFLGAYRHPGEIGRLYLPVWLAVALPLQVLAGLALLAFPRFARHALARCTPEGVVALLAAALLPLGVAIAKSQLAYNGLRHFLFTLPPLAALAALGWVGLWRSTQDRRIARRLVAGAALLLTLEPLAWTARARQYAYVYFNPLAGGISRASWRFDGDYWALSLRSAAAVLDRLAEREPRTGRWRVAVTAHTRPLTLFLRHRDRFLFVRLPKHLERFDLLVPLGYYDWRLPSELPPHETLFEARVTDGQKPFARVLRVLRPTVSATADEIDERADTPVDNDEGEAPDPDPPV